MGLLPTALVTGAAKRIGRAIAIELSRAGWRVAVHHHSSGEDAEQTVSDIKAAGGEAIALQADLSNLDAVGELIPDCCENFGCPTCLINNASLFEHDRIETLTADGWHRHLDINLRAPVFLARAFAANLPGGEKGAVINLLDQRVWKLTPDFFSYTVSKSGLWTATRTLAQALAPDVRVNAIGPGPALANERQSAEDLKRQQRSTILQRGPELDEICAAVRFILDAPSMTGQMIALDGGQHLAWRTPDIVDTNPKQ
jgi:NAD(P)-dependent dehydrogenase (short-subunit alcohol dehydrogenase family)